MNTALPFDPRGNRLLFLLIALLLLSGCAGTPAISYYQLTAIDTGHAVGKTESTTGDLVVGLGPIQLPEMLERPQILTRTGANRIVPADSHRWIEPLPENISRVIRENLAVLLGTERILTYPWSRTTRLDYQITIDILRFEGKGLHEGQIEAVWSILDHDGKILRPQRRSGYTVATATSDYEGLTQALSESLFLFCRETAEELAREANH